MRTCKRLATTVTLLAGLMTPSAGAQTGSTEPTRVHAVYVVPFDIEPVADRPAAISDTVLEVQDWFSEQTGGTYPVFTRTAAQISVPTVTLTQTRAELAALGRSAADATMTEQVHTLAPATTGAELVLIVEGAINTGACGYQSSIIVIPIDNCGITPAVSTTFPFGATYLVAHELTHLLGAASRTCAPNSDGTGHVDDDNRDIIYAGPEGRDWFNLMLDPGNDDYYNHGVEGCPDIADSPLLGTWQSAPPLTGACAGLVPTHLGTEGDDIIYGTEGDDIIVSLGGNDRIWALGGDDIVCAGDGNDRMFGGSGNNSMYGEAGIDKMRSGGGADLLSGGDSRDYLKSGHGDDTILGGAGPDHIRASAGDDVVSGGADADVMWGGPGNDQLAGDGGNDLLKGSAGADSCAGGAGFDIAHVTCNETGSIEAIIGS